MLPGTQIGPVTTAIQHRKILDYIDIAKAEGARCVLGVSAAGKAPGVLVSSCNRRYLPTLRIGMRIAQEEVFGPVLAVIRFQDEDEAISIANDVNYGLAAGVWTENMRRGGARFAAPGSWHCLGQHVSLDQLYHAVRWLQGEWHRPRKWRGCHL